VVEVRAQLGTPGVQGAAEPGQLGYRASAQVGDQLLRTAANSSRIRGSTSSTIEPTGARAYRGGPSAANAAFTVFFEHPTTPSNRLDRHRLGPMQPADLRPVLRAQHPPDLEERGSFHPPPGGQLSGAVDSDLPAPGLRG
jgi:hypothetical protein